MKGVIAIAEQPMTGAADMGQVVKALLASGGKKAEAAEYARAAHMSDRAIRILTKAPIGGLTISNSPDLVDWRIAGKSFFTMLRTESVFMRLLDKGFRRVPLRERVGMVATNATALARAEGQPFPVSAVTLDGQTLEPVPVGVILVMTDQLAKNMTADATNLIYAELRGAVSYAVDSEFFSIVMDSATPSIPSAGLGAAGMMEDVRLLLSLVNTTAAGYLVWAMSPDVANDATILDERNAMTPMGGEFFGIPAMVAHSLPAGTLRLINGAGIAAAGDGMEVQASNEATLQMVDNPTNNSVTPTATTLVSMFQTNSTALLAKISIGAERMRDDAVAEVTGVAWLEPDGS
jgi:hypothetical protein